MVEALKARDWASLDPRDATLCTVADKISADATKMTDEDWAPIRELGYGDREVMEITHIVGFMNYATRLADGLGLETDPGFLED